MVVLAGLCLVTWFCVGHRAVCLSAGNLRAWSDLARRQCSDDEHRTNKKRELESQAFLVSINLRLMERESLLDACVLAAPLLGLLGTIMGMIETFEAMAASTAAAPADAMSDGISKAMLTTQVGLLVALPGLMVAQALKSKKRRFLRAVESILNDTPDVDNRRKHHHHTHTLGGPAR